MDKELLKSRLTEYLLSVGSYPDKKAGRNKYTCPVPNCGSGTHRSKDSDGALNVTGEKWYCHSCHNGGDIFTLAGLINNTTDFKEQLHHVCAALNIEETITFSMADKSLKNETAKDNKDMTERIDYTDFLQECANNGADYFLQRGLSIDTIKRFRLGTINTTTLANYTASCKLSNGLRVGDVTIPYLNEKGEYIYFIARATNVEPNNKGTYPKFKKPQSEYAGEEPVYNYPALLFAKETEPVFICEGQIDALSIYEVGGKGIALNGTGVDKVTKLDFLSNIKCPVVIALDNDEAGARATNELKEVLATAGIRCTVFQHQRGIKDVNAALMHDRERLAGQVAYYKRMFAPVQEVESYNDIPTGDMLGELLKAINEHKSTKTISTGFKSIDELLDGGIREGLYFIGAVSSLGKTALVLQIADHIAKSGQDVLFISLEMSRHELMARSISRYTYEYAQDKFPLDFFSEGQGRVPTTALTTIGVLQGKAVGENQKASFVHACEQYTNNEGKHLFIVEGVGNIGYAEVRRYVEEHQRRNGTLPVVVIDYIQLLGIADNSAASDKQKIDKAVMELKRMSRDFKIPVIGISSLNRESYNKAMSMSAFKESGAVEYTADVLIGLQVTGAEKQNDKNNTDFETVLKQNEEKIKKAQPISIDFKILKNRNGRRGTTQLQFVSMFNHYQESDKNTKPFTNPAPKKMKSI